MSNLTIDLDALVASVRKQAAERPDYAYQSPGYGSACVYVNPDETPGCIVGHAFFDLGFTAEQVALFDKTEDIDDKGMDETKWSSSIPYVLRWDFDLGKEAEDDVRVRWLKRVQSSQDMGDTWSHAVVVADNAYPLT